ncbi:MAG: 1,4-dihydroxy-2-naphthoyl-CoA hydrolase [bacterium]
MNAPCASTAAFAPSPLALGLSGMPDLAGGVYPVGPGAALDDVLGLEFLGGDAGSARARMPVEDRVRQRFGVVHGGAYAMLAEAASSIGTAVQVWDAGAVPVGMSNDTSFLRPARAGWVHAEAERLHGGRTTWAWQVRLSDDDGRLCAFSRVTLAILRRDEIAARTPAGDGTRQPAAEPAARRPWAGMPDVTGGVYPVAAGRCLDDVLAFEFVDSDETTGRGRVPVADRVRQRMGIVHGGVYAALAEMVATEATVAQVWGAGQVAMGISNGTSFLRPVFAGAVHAAARLRHRGRTTWLWDVDLSDDHGRLCATSRVTVAVRRRPPGGAGRP